MQLTERWIIGLTMENSNEKSNFEIRVVTENYYLEKAMINEKVCSFSKGTNEYIVSVKQQEDIDMYFIPKYFEKFKILKMILFLIENLFSGGSGKSINELKNEMMGFHIYGKINNANNVINIDKNQYSDLKCTQYISKKLNMTFGIFNYIPMIILVFIVVAFFSWAICKIL